VEPERQITIDGEDFVDHPISGGDQSVHYDFSYLEDTNLKDSQIAHRDCDTNILNWMVRFCNLCIYPLIFNAHHMYVYLRVSASEIQSNDCNTTASCLLSTVLCMNT